MNEPGNFAGFAGADDGIPDPKTVRQRMSVEALLLLLGWTILADWLIYRTVGFSGPAVFVAIVPLFFVLRLGSFDALSRVSRTSLLTRLACVALLLLIALRLMMLGTVAVLLSGILVTFALALAHSSVFPWALETIALSVRSLIDGVAWLARHRLPALSRHAHAVSDTARTLSWLLPFIACGVFGGIFVFANPDLFDAVSLRVQRLSNWALDWLGGISALELPFCALAFIMACGLFYPHFGRMRIGGLDVPAASVADRETRLYQAFRNTLACLIVLFIVYLVFEFQTLWKRDFPDGFYYAGYAHQGAAWLTAALALATGLLSIVFHGATLSDRRIHRLKHLAWVWSGLNFLLAISVYNRLCIYVGYNGLTWMRIVGFFGITTVVAGFVLVLVKIQQRRGFWWLMRTQLTALLISVIAFTVFPVDYVAHRYNAWRVNSGYLHPSVMIAVKPKDESGYLPMLDLIECEDVLIREGVRAMLAERQIAIETEIQAKPWHWTRYQGVTSELYRRLAGREATWDNYREDPTSRQIAIDDFRDYAMQWY